MGLAGGESRGGARASEKQPQFRSAEYVDSDSDSSEGREEEGEEGKGRGRLVDSAEDSTDSGKEKAAGHRDGELPPPENKPQRRGLGIYIGLTTCTLNTHAHTHTPLTHLSHSPQQGSGPGEGSLRAWLCPACVLAGGLPQQRGPGPSSGW